MMEARKLGSNPLAELRRRARQRGQCDENGAAVGFPVPWAAAVATSGAGFAAPALRSLGIQAVDEAGFVFVVRGELGGGAAAGGAPLASVCHLAGNYPGAGFEEQWRAEGVVRPLRGPDLEVKKPDSHLVAQFLACRAFEGAHRPRQRPDARGRTPMSAASGAEVEELARDVQEAEQRLHDRAVPVQDMLSAGLASYRVVPLRMELLEGGPAWPQGPARYQWTRDTPNAPWAGPTRILPYSVPKKDRLTAWLPLPPMAAVAPFLFGFQLATLLFLLAGLWHSLM